MYFTATAGQLIISCVVIGSQLSSYFSDINVYQSQWGVFLSDVIVVFRISAWVLLLRGLYKGREEKKIRNNDKQLNELSQDYTKWELVDQVGNIFNRLVLFNSKQFHASLDYFGTNKENGRLFQVFFFTTER